MFYYLIIFVLLFFFLFYLIASHQISVGPNDESLFDEISYSKGKFFNSFLLKIDLK